METRVVRVVTMLDNPLPKSEERVVPVVITKVGGNTVATPKNELARSSTSNRQASAHRKMHRRKINIQTLWIDSRV